MLGKALPRPQRHPRPAQRSGRPLRRPAPPVAVAEWADWQKCQVPGVDRARRALAAPAVGAAVVPSRICPARVVCPDEEVRPPLSMLLLLRDRPLLGLSLEGEALVLSHQRHRRISRKFRPKASNQEGARSAEHLLNWGIDPMHTKEVTFVDAARDQVVSLWTAGA